MRPLPTSSYTCGSNYAISLLINVPAIVASRCIIEHKYNRLDTLGQKLSDVLGEEEAEKIMADLYIERMQ
jgi:hypothetical protein